MKIRSRLIASNVGIVLFAILLVAIPVLSLQTAELQRNIEQSADLTMSLAQRGITSFLQKAEVIVEDTAAYVHHNPLVEETAIQTFDESIRGDDTLYALYYVDTVPVSRGGIFYSSDGWVPDADYDKTTRDWYSRSIASQATVITEPYVDATTGDLVASVSRAVRTGGQRTGRCQP